MAKRPLKDERLRTCALAPSFRNPSGISQKRLSRDQKNQRGPPVRSYTVSRYLKLPVPQIQAPGNVKVLQTPSCVFGNHMDMSTTRAEEHTSKSVHQEGIQSSALLGNPHIHTNGLDLPALSGSTRASTPRFIRVQCNTLIPKRSVRPVTQQCTLGFEHLWQCSRDLH